MDAVAGAVSEQKGEKMRRLIDEDTVLKTLHDFFDGMLEADTWSPCDLYSIIENLPSVQPERKTEWIPIKWHDCTDADREKYGFSDDIVAVFDCEMPDDDQAILVTTSHGYVNQDVCYIDDGYSLDSGYDWIDDITAWMPLPLPYQGEGEEE